MFRHGDRVRFPSACGEQCGTVFAPRDGNSYFVLPDDAEEPVLVPADWLDPLPDEADTPLLVPANDSRA